MWEELGPALRYDAACVPVAQASDAFGRMMRGLHFCKDCRANVKDAFSVLIGAKPLPDVVPPDDDVELCCYEDMFAPFHLARAPSGDAPPGAAESPCEPWDGPRVCCMLEQVPALVHHAVDANEKDEVARGEGRSAERHAPTLRDGQAEVIRLMGELLLARLKKNWAQHAIQKQTAVLILCLSLQCFRTNLERKVEERVGNAALEDLLRLDANDGKDGGGAKSKKSKKKKKKKKKAKEKAAAAAAAKKAEEDAEAERRKKRKQQQQQKQKQKQQQKEQQQQAAAAAPAPPQKGKKRKSKGKNSPRGSNGNGGDGKATGGVGGGSSLLDGGGDDGGASFLTPEEIAEFKALAAARKAKGKDRSDLRSKLKANFSNWCAKADKDGKGPDGGGAATS